MEKTRIHLLVAPKIKPLQSPILNSTSSKLIILSHQEQIYKKKDHLQFLQMATNWRGKVLPAPRSWMATAITPMTMLTTIWWHQQATKTFSWIGLQPPTIKVPQVTASLRISWGISLFSNWIMHPMPGSQRTRFPPSGWAKPAKPLTWTLNSLRLRYPPFFHQQ